MMSRHILVLVLCAAAAVPARAVTQRRPAVHDLRGGDGKPKPFESQAHHGHEPKPKPFESQAHHGHEPKPFKSPKDCPAPSGSKSYSQFQEDELLWKTYFCNKTNGTFMEMGALDGVMLSNTKFFEDSVGWRGGLVEAMPKTARRLSQNRNNVTNKIFQEAACAAGVGHLKFVDTKATAFGHTEDSTKSTEGETISVPCRPMGEMVRETLAHTGAKQIDFFSLDVEGGELAVLETMDWSLPVMLWMVELDGSNPKKDEGVRKLLRDNGYTYEGKFGNTINEAWKKKA